MPYSSVKEARESIPSLKSLTDAQVSKFNKIFNAMVKAGDDESKAIPIAIAQAKKDDKVSKSVDEDNIINQFNSLIEKASLQSRKEMLELLHDVTEADEINKSTVSVEDSSVDNSSKQVIAKSVNQEERLALFVALAPLEAEDVDENDYDLHQDTYSAQSVRKGMLSYNQHCMKAGLYHLFETQDAIVTQSYLAPVDFSIEDSRGEEHIIKQGTWLQEWYFPETEKGEEIWKKVKSGELSGISIQCNATVEDIDE